VAIRASVDIPLAVHITAKFEIREQGAEVKVSREWEAELERLLSEYYDEEGAKAKADIESYWINIRDTLARQIYRRTR